MTEGILPTAFDRYLVGDPVRITQLPASPKGQEIFSKLAADAPQTSPFEFSVQKPTPMQRIEFIDSLRRHVNKSFMPSSCAKDSYNSAPSKVIYQCKQFPAFPEVSSTNKSGLFRFLPDVSNDHVFANLALQGLQILTDLTTEVVLIRVADDRQNWHLWTNAKTMPLDRWQVDRAALLL